MTETYEGRDTFVETTEPDMGNGSVVAGKAAAPVTIGMRNIERDAAGIPSAVFEGRLTPAMRPTADARALEVSMFWRDSLMTVAYVEKARGITVGPAKNTDFPVSLAGLGGGFFTIAQPTGDGGYLVNFADSMVVEVRNEENEILARDRLVKASRVTQGATAEGVKVGQVKLALGERAAVQVGEVTFLLQYVKPTNHIKPGIGKAIDYYFTTVLAVSILAHVFFVLSLFLAPPSDDALADDLSKNPNKLISMVLKKEEKKPEPKKQELSGKKGGGKAKKEEGKFGKPKDNKNAAASTKGAPRVDPNKRELDRKIALESGLFAALNKGPQGAVSNVLGPGGLGTGINSALGGLRGTEMGDAGGAGGLGTRGTGPGGGGNSYGIGGLGSGDGFGTGGKGDVDLGGRGKGKYSVVPGRTITKGCLTQEVVGRVITRHQSQVKYCYEKELQRNPNLAGKVTSSFIIGPTGDVMTARVSESTMGDATVEECITRVIQRMKFPPCAGGGTADVTYPWIFKSGGN